MKHLKHLIAVFSLLILSSNASANVIAIDLPDTLADQRSTASYWVFGFDFIANTDLLVTELGYFDSFKDGLTESHEVGIFDENGVLLTSGVVTNANTLEGWFRWVEIAEIVLKAGSKYSVMGVAGSELYAADIANTDLVIDTNITYLNTVYNDSGALTSGGSGFRSISFFGGNFKATAVPAPSTLVLFLLSGLIIVRKRRKA